MGRRVRQMTYIASTLKPYQVSPPPGCVSHLTLKGLWYQVGCLQFYAQYVKIYPMCEPRCPSLLSLGKTGTWAEGEKTWPNLKPDGTKITSNIWLNHICLWCFSARFYRPLEVKECVHGVAVVVCGGGYLCACVFLCVCGMCAWVHVCKVCMCMSVSKCVTGCLCRNVCVCVWWWWCVSMCWGVGSSYLIFHFVDA